MQNESDAVSIAFRKLGAPFGVAYRCGREDEETTHTLDALPAVEFEGILP